jgi:hypothetical protein
MQAACRFAPKSGLALHKSIAKGQKRIFRAQRKKLANTKTTTEMIIAAANASPIILPSCSGHPVFGSKYLIVCSPAASKVSFSRKLAMNFKIPNGYRNNSHRNEPTYLPPGHSTKPSVRRQKFHALMEEIDAKNQTTD